MTVSALATLPSWGDVIEETLQWGASRVRSRDGTAERVELLSPWPTRTFRLSGWANIATDRAALDLGEGEHSIPWLPGKSRVTEVVSGTEYSIYGDPVARGFVSGAEAVFETPAGDTEVVTLGAITSNVFLTGSPTMTIVEGTTLTPLIEAVLDDDQVQVIRLSPRGATQDVVWRVLDTQHVGAGGSADEDWTGTLDSIEVIERLAQSSEGNQVSSERFAGLGGAWRRVVPGDPQTFISQQHVFTSAPEVLEFREWLYRRRGPLLPCWVPHGMSLGTPQIETHESTAVIEIDDPGDDTVHDLRQAVIAWATDGTASSHTVGDILRYGEASVPEGRAWLIGLDPVLSASDLQAVQWLVHCRLTNTVTLRWHSPEAVEVALTWLSTPLEES